MTRNASPLWQAVVAQHMRTVAVMGMCKNTGKTVTLNHLLACAAQAGEVVGLTSIGRDGEAQDAVFAIPKPPVLVWPGMVVATAQDTLVRAQVKTRLLGSTGVASPMGEIVLVQVQQAGAMEVAGASRNQDQLRVVEKLRLCGVDRVLVDGALGRSHHASPAMADGVVLATGAALGGGVLDVLRKTRDRLAILGLPGVDERSRLQLGAFFDGSGVALWAADADDKPQPLWQAEVASLNAAPALLAQADAAQAAGVRIGMVACTGAVGQRLWAALLTLAQQHPGLRVVVADGTRVFVDAVDVARLQATGALLMAWRPIVVLGVTVNPFSPLGGHLDAQELLVAARAALTQYVVSDVVQEQVHGPVTA